MKVTLAALILMLGIMGVADTALAKGCLKGAAVGGVAGHFVGGHGVLGAAAGCLIGRHEAKKREQQRLQQENGADGHAPNGSGDAPRI
jgi:outer membrane lipoprotein SlyB